MNSTQTFGWGQPVGVARVQRGRWAATLGWLAVGGVLGVAWCVAAFAALTVTGLASLVVLAGGVAALSLGGRRLPPRSVAGLVVGVVAGFAMPIAYVAYVFVNSPWFTF